jgi:hypothetical protein
MKSELHRHPAFITGTVFLVAFLLFQLAPLWINRQDFSPDKSQNKCNPRLNRIEDPRFISRPDDTIKVIRLTNSGEFVSRCELTNALYELNWDRPFRSEAYGPLVKPGAKHLPKLAVLYIHGWKHSADKNDDDLAHFNDLVTSLRSRYGDTRRVVGIYIGWNASAGFWSWAEFLENLTFWVKKNNADRIAQGSAVTMIVSAVGTIVKSDPDQQDEFIAVGHSFGARLLYSATAQALVVASEMAHPGYPTGTYATFEGLANAVILLNPAFEASRYSAINDFSRNDESFSSTQAPLLITVSSNHDQATKYFFPIGQWLGLARTDREKTTLGNYDPFQTHVLKRSSKEDCLQERGVNNYEPYYAAKLCLTRVSPITESETHFRHGGVTQEYNPFIVARTDESVIADHNDIWNPDFREWLTALIQSLQRKHAEVPKSSVATDQTGLDR